MDRIQIFYYVGIVNTDRKTTLDIYRVLYNTGVAQYMLRTTSKRCWNADLNCYRMPQDRSNECSNSVIQ